jgi:hypothetical protein
MADNHIFCPLLPCYVCKNTLSENPPIVSLKCGHVFHLICVDKWRNQGHRNYQNCPQQIIFGCEPCSMKQKLLLPSLECECHKTKLDVARELKEKVWNVIFWLSIRVNFFNLRMKPLLKWCKINWKWNKPLMI